MTCFGIRVKFSACSELAKSGMQEDSEQTNASHSAVSAVADEAAAAAPGAQTPDQALAAAEGELAALRQQFQALKVEKDQLATARAKEHGIARSKVEALTGEKDELAAALARANSASEAAAKELAAARDEIRALTAERDALSGKAEAGAKELAAARELAQALTAERGKLAAERDKLAAELAQARRSAEAASGDHVAAREQIVELTGLRDRAVSEAAEIRAWAESVLTQANTLHDRLQTIDGESLVAFIRRRYFGKK